VKVGFPMTGNSTILIGLEGSVMVVSFELRIIKFPTGIDLN